MSKPLPNRLAVYVTAVGALAAGLLPLIGNMDWESTAGILGAIVAITGVVAVWLYNWGQWERSEGAGPEPFVATANPGGTTFEQPGPAIPRDARPEG